MIFVKHDLGTQMGDLSRRFKDHSDGAEMRRNLRKRIRAAAKPVEADIRAAVMGVSVTSSKGGNAPPNDSTQLRARVAKAVTTRITARGVRIEVSSRRFKGEGNPKHRMRLPKYLSGELKSYNRWRHPVFGNRENWVEQTGSPYFFVTIHKHRTDFRRAVGDAIRDTLEQIAD